MQAFCCTVNGYAAGRSLGFLDAEGECGDGHE